MRAEAGQVKGRGMHMVRSRERRCVREDKSRTTGCRWLGHWNLYQVEDGPKGKRNTEAGLDIGVPKRNGPGLRWYPATILCQSPTSLNSLPSSFSESSLPVSARSTLLEDCMFLFRIFALFYVHLLVLLGMQSGTPRDTRIFDKMDIINIITNTYSCSIKAVDTWYGNIIYSTGFHCARFQHVSISFVHSRNTFCGDIWDFLVIQLQSNCSDW